MRGARTLPLLGTVVASVAVYPIRVLRWRALMQRDKPLPFIPLWHATTIGFAINNILPARAGEIARAYAARKLTGTSFSTALVTIIISRILDGVTLFLLLAVAAAAGWLATDAVIAGVPIGRIMGTATAIFGALSFMALAAVHFPNPMIAMARKFTNVVMPQRWSDRVIKGLTNVLDSLAVLRSWKRLGLVMVLSLLLWCINALSFGLCFVAFNLDVPWHAAFVLQSLINFGLVIPSTPGFVGVFEAITRAALGIYGIAPGPAVSYAVAYHFCTYIPITLIGLWSLTRARFRMSEIQEQVQERISGTIQRMTGRHPRIDAG